MDKEAIFSDAKLEMNQIINDLHIKNVSESRKQLDHYFDFLDSLLKLESPKKSSDTQKMEPAEIKMSEKKGQVSTEEQKVNEGFLFERKLKGGFIPDLDAYVPEKVIRRLGLTDGDLVKATQVGGGYFDFELVEKGAGIDSDRGEIKYCIVEKDGYLWVCNRTLSGKSIHLDDMPFTMHLKDSEIQAFHLSEGDIVDVAYAKDNPTVCKVVWKHKIEDASAPSPLPSGFYKEKSENERVIQQHPDLKGKTITLIGCINRYPAYRERLAALGSNVFAMDGTEDEDRVAATIQKSDMVLMIIPAVSHGGAALAKKHCKASEIPFSTIDSIGISSVVNGAVDLAKAISLDAVN